MVKKNKPFVGEQPTLFDLLPYESISLGRQIQNEEIERESDAYNEALYQKSVENNLETQPDCQEKNSPTPQSLKGRPPGSTNKKKSGSFYKRGVNKKGVEQWSFHYHYYDDNNKLRKTSVSVPFEKLRQAKNIAHFKGTEAVISFLKRGVMRSF